MQEIRNEETMRTMLMRRTTDDLRVIYSNLKWGKSHVLHIGILIAAIVESRYSNTEAIQEALTISNRSKRDAFFRIFSSERLSEIKSKMLQILLNKDYEHFAIRLTSMMDSIERIQSNRNYRVELINTL